MSRSRSNGTAWSVVLLVGLFGLAPLAGSVAVPVATSAGTVHFAPELVPGAITRLNSTNWAGYAVNSTVGAVTEVQANWTMPKFHGHCSGSFNYSAAAFWVGIDGVNSKTVEQIGTAIECLAFLGSGSVSYFAWYELYPAGLTMLSLNVSPGNHLSASVQYYPSTSIFVLSISDLTNGQSTSVSAGNLSVNRSSAEWVAEAPSSFGGVLPLVDFGTVPFTGAYATISGSHKAAGAFHPWDIRMVNTAGTATKAYPTNLAHGGTSFKVIWVTWGP
jgi:hypothetical protein